MAHFNGLGMHLGTLSRLSAARTRSISPENFDGAKGRGGMATEGTGAEAARDLGLSWKISPSIRIDAGETRVLADIQSGRFARDWVLENKAGQVSFKAMRARHAAHNIEEVGQRLRGMMPWIGQGALVDKSRN